MQDFKLFLYIRILYACFKRIVYDRRSRMIFLVSPASAESYEWQTSKEGSSVLQRRIFNLDNRLISVYITSNFR